MSWGRGCAEPGYPGVYADVFKVRKWIINTIRPTLAARVDLMVARALGECQGRITIRDILTNSIQNSGAPLPFKIPGNVLNNQVSVNQDEEEEEEDNRDEDRMTTGNQDILWQLDLLTRVSQVDKIHIDMTTF